MCGVIGFWSPQLPGNGLADTATRMADALAYRGPDDAGVWTDDRCGVALGHRRLAIIDVSAAGHQPMLSHDGRFVLTFNGEIYNHQELRARLEQENAAPQWRGHSDTETFLAGIVAWGLRATLERAVGMFALALWDRAERTLQLARDRLGEKPLYYGWVDGALVFGSELKALWTFPGFRRTINRDVLALYMQLGNVPAPHSIFENTYKVRPAGLLTVSSEDFARRTPRLESYWSFPQTVSRSLARTITDEAEALGALESRLKDAVAGQSIADVPLGAFLSGGIDSSLIAALMQAQSPGKVKTYTVGFDEAGFDESPYARAVATHLGTEHHEVRVSAQDARNVIPLLPAIYDEPFADSSQIATYLVCKAARTEVKVALSGDGGDELFGGYNRYFWSRSIWGVWNRMPEFARRAALSTLGRVPAGAFDRLARMVGAESRVAHLGAKVHKLLHRLQNVRQIDQLHRSLLTEWSPRLNFVRGATDTPPFVFEEALPTSSVELEQAMMMFDTVTYLPDDVLTKVDRAAMSVSLETRVPFLDHRVLEFAWRLPLDMKIRKRQGKWALRQILYKYVPRELFERPKAGFAVPVGEWLRGPLRGWADDLLDPDRIAREGYLDAAQVRTAWEQHLTRRQDWTERLWYVLVFQSWLRENT